MLDLSGLSNFELVVVLTHSIAFPTSVLLLLMVLMVLIVSIVLTVLIVLIVLMVLMVLIVLIVLILMVNTHARRTTNELSVVYDDTINTVRRPWIWLHLTLCCLPHCVQCSSLTDGMTAPCSNQRIYALHSYRTVVITVPLLEITYPCTPNGHIIYIEWTSIGHQMGRKVHVSNRH